MEKLTKQQIKELYGAKNLPKYKNFIGCIYLGIAKFLAIIIFGIGAVILAVFVFPFIRLFAAISNLFHKEKKDFGIIARAYVSHTFRIFLGMLKLSGVAHAQVDDRQAMKNLHKTVIVSNHPSMLDFVYFMAYVPNSTCIVRGSLTKTPLAGVIKQAYITNTTDFDQLLVECKKVTDKGCNVIIFPEGTRTPRNGHYAYKKGASRIALYCDCDIQPYFLGGSDKYGLGKHDPLLSYNHAEKLFYDFKTLEKIHISDYKDLSEPIAAKRITNKIEEEVKKAAAEYELNHTCRTLNNV